MSSAEKITTSDEIGESFVPMPLSGVEQVVLGDELVLLNGWSSATATNAVGALIWGSFDGVASLAEIVDDLSEATGADRGVVGHDVLAFTRQLAAEGYLDGAGPPEWDPGFKLVPIPELEAGDVPTDSTFVGLDGAAHQLADLRGGQALLVNWSPDCGYCWIIAERLGVLVEPLAERGVTLVLTATGDADTNRAFSDAAGGGLPVWVRTGEADPFSGNGTPCCYHVDDQGRLLTPIVHGSDAVLALASELAGVDPVTLLTDAESDPVPAGTRYLMAGDDTCAPSDGQAVLRSWQEPHTYRMGNFHVGLRPDSNATGDLIDSLFEGRRVRDRRAGYSFSLALGSVADRAPSSAAAGPSVRDLDLLVRGSGVEVRTRFPSRVLRALLWRLDDEIHGYEVPDDHLRVQATAALIDGSALLLPPGLVAFSPSMQGHFARAGITLADMPYPEIDLATAELVVPEPRVEHDRSVLENLDRPVASAIELPPVRPGRYPLSAWVVIRPGTEVVVDLSPAEAASATLSLMWEAEDPAERVRELARLFTKIRGVGIWYDSEPGMVERVRSAVSG